jgi:acetoin utilization deacetylase AcuC-like enzyme
MRMKTFYSPKCLGYKYPDHPESPDRISRTAKYLAEKGCSFIEPSPALKEDILRVHSRKMFDGIKTGTQSDYDTPAIPGIFDDAMLSAGSAILAAETTSETEPAFSLMRPPGHHATKNRVMGFCYFNNIAIASAKVLDHFPKSKIAILDIDCHHGNGTEDIFLNHSSLIYVSLHQSPLYPGTGLQSRGNCYNFPLLPGTEETGYLETLQKACEIIRQFSPALIGVSAGFDTCRNDPLTQLNLDVESYQKIGEMISGLEIPTFIVMEGGYSSDLPECVFSFLMGFEQKVELN